MTNFDRINQARLNTAYDYLRARNSLLSRIEYSRKLHPQATKADEAALYALRESLQRDIDRLILCGYKNYYSCAITSLFADVNNKTSQEKAAYAVSAYDVMKDYTDQELIQLYEISQTNLYRKCA